MDAALFRSVPNSPAHRPKTRAGEECPTIRLEDSLPVPARCTSDACERGFGVLGNDRRNTYANGTPPYIPNWSMKGL